MVRSQFEHCFVIWAPKLQNEIDKFEKVQKRAIKWILRQEHCSYANIATYYSKCKETLTNLLISQLGYLQTT